jgi:ribosomal subunit interface protein
MTFPLTVTFRGMDHSEALDAVIRDKVDNVRRKFQTIVSFRVTVEAPSKHHKHGDQFHVNLDVNVPGKEFVANRAPVGHHAHDDVNVAIRDAFRAMERELTQHFDRQHGRVKRHTQP